jgi:hypothetical protein
VVPLAKHYSWYLAHARRTDRKIKQDEKEEMEKKNVSFLLFDWLYYFRKGKTKILLVNLEQVC